MQEQVQHRVVLREYAFGDAESLVRVVEVFLCVELLDDHQGLAHGTVGQRELDCVTAVDLLSRHQRVLGN